MLPPPVSKVRGALHGSDANVAAARFQRGIASDRSNGDMAAAGIRVELAGKCS